MARPSLASVTPQAEVFIEPHCVCVSQELLVTILREWTAAYGPLLLILDDFDRADALSWTFLARMAEEIDMAVLVVAAIRPNDGIFATPGLGQARCQLCMVC